MKIKLLLPFLVLASFFYANVSLADPDKISYRVCSAPESRGDVRILHGAEFYDIPAGGCIPKAGFFESTLFFDDVYLTLPTGSADIFPIPEIKISNYLRGRTNVVVTTKVETGEVCAINADDPDIVYRKRTVKYDIQGNSGQFTGCVGLLRFGVRP